MSTIKIIADNIKKIRHKQSLSIQKLSNSSGYSRAYLYDLESGKKNPTIKSLEKLCKYLHCDLNEIIQPISEKALLNKTDKELFNRIKKLSTSSKKKALKLLDFIEEL
jgi:transcriptional regulator with XRE-family HTH domain